METYSKKSKFAIPVFLYSFASFISKVSGYLRDLFLASFIGASALSDIFLIALRLPYSFRRAVSEESLNPAFIPIFGKLSDQEDKNLKYKFTKKILLVFFFISLFITIFVEIFMPQILSIFSYGIESSAQQEMLVSTSRIVFPYLIFIALTAVLMANLNANNKFGTSGGIPSVLNLTLVLAIYFFNFFGENKLTYLAWSVIIGGLFQALILFFLVEKEFWNILFKFKKLNIRLKGFYSLYWPTLLYSSFFQINFLLGIFLCSFQEGAVSYIYYAERIFYLPLTLIGIAIGVVLVPNLSDYLRNDNKALALNYMNVASKYALLTILPLTGFLFALSPEIVSVLFERGEFSSESSFNTSLVLKAFLIGLPAATMVKVLTPYFFAIEKPKIFLKVSTYANFINLVMMFLLFYFFGFYGIPIALSISSYSLIFFLIKEHKKKNFFNFSKIQLNDSIKYFILSLIIYFSCSETSSINYIKEMSLIFVLMSSLCVAVTIFLLFIFIFERSLYNRVIRSISNKIS